MEDNLYSEEFDEIDEFAKKYGNLAQKQKAEEDREAKRLEKQKLNKGLGLDDKNQKYKPKFKKLIKRKPQRDYDDL